jgi:transcriptional regulator with XRE-family HTH domain
MALSSNIRDYRLKSGYTIEEFSNLVGVNEINVCEWELGVKEPSLNELIIISGIFGVELDELISSNSAESKSQNHRELPIRTPKPKTNHNQKIYFIITGVVAFIICIILILTTMFTIVPDIQGTSKDVAIQRLISLGFIPTEKYEFSSNTESGMIIRTDPKPNGVALSGSKIEVIISKGSLISNSTKFVYQWTNLPSYSYGNQKSDKWNIKNLYIDNERRIMIIEFSEVVLQAQYTFQSSSTPGEGFGKAYIYGPEYLETPITIKYENQFFEKDTPNSFVVEVPLEDSNNEKPTNLDIEIMGSVQSFYGLTNYNIVLSITISW